MSVQYIHADMYIAYCCDHNCYINLPGYLETFLSVYMVNNSKCITACFYLILFLLFSCDIFRTFTFS